MKIISKCVLFFFVFLCLFSQAKTGRVHQHGPGIVEEGLFGSMMSNSAIPITF